MGLNITVGAKLKNPTSASAVACPVSWYAQIVKPNWVIAVPMSEINCPIHTSTNARIPEGIGSD
jgi:hypothetical protein